MSTNGNGKMIKDSTHGRIDRPHERECVVGVRFAWSGE